MSRKATNAALAALHAALAETMGKILKEGVTATNDDGEVVKLTPGAPYLSVIRQFLKDNNIDQLPADLEETLRDAGKAKSNLPSFSPDTDEYGLAN